jgi:hypothetical protein
MKTVPLKHIPSGKMMQFKDDLLHSKEDMMERDYNSTKYLRWIISEEFF